MTRPRGHLAAAALAAPALGALLGSAGATAVIVQGPSACAAATYTSHVTLVVEHGGGGVIGLCIGFDGSSISGEQILRASGLEYATSTYGSMGDAVCQIDHEPDTYPPGCWTGSSPYWAMFVSRGGGAWGPADHGISSETFGNGDAEGFRYDPQSGAEPAPASPAGICAAALAGHTPAPAASAAAPAPPGSSRATPNANAPPATASTPPPAAGTASGATPSAAVVGPPAGGTTGAAATASGTAAPGLNPALLVASAAGGLLVGSAVIQLVLRKRRA